MNEGVVLLVEDNADDVELTLRSLKKNNIKNPVVVARDGAEALDYLFCQGAHANRAASEMPHVVLLDLKLPKVDGLEVLRRMRENPTTRCLPVVVLTSSKEEQDVAEAYGLGTNSYVRKPVDFDEFVRATGQLGLYWLLLNEPPPPSAGEGND